MQKEILKDNSDAAINLPLDVGKSALLDSDEGILIKLCRNGDEEAFTALYEKYRSRLYSFLTYKLSGNNSLVDDIFQQTWLKALNNLHRYKHKNSILPWLQTIAGNLIIDHFRAGARRETVPIIENLHADTYDPQETKEQEQLDKALYEAIAKLSEEQREVVLMRIEEISFKEIAKAKNISLNTALGRHQYAIRNLRKLMDVYL